MLPYYIIILNMTCFGLYVLSGNPIFVHTKDIISMVISFKEKCYCNSSRTIHYACMVRPAILRLTITLRIRAYSYPE